MLAASTQAIEILTLKGARTSVSPSTNVLIQITSWLNYQVTIYAYQLGTDAAFLHYTTPSTIVVTAESLRRQPRYVRTAVGGRDGGMLRATRGFPNKGGDK